MPQNTNKYLLVSFGMFWIFKKNFWKEGPWNSQWVTLLMSRRHARESLRMTCRLAVCRKKCLQWASWLTLDYSTIQETHCNSHQRLSHSHSAASVGSWPWPSAVKPTLTCLWAGIGICFPVLFQAVGDCWLVTGAILFDSSTIADLLTDVNLSLVPVAFWTEQRHCFGFTWSIAMGLVDQHSNHNHNMDISWTMFLRPGDL